VVISKVGVWLGERKLPATSHASRRSGKRPEPHEFSFGIWV
jgi:hypothetical protein